MKCWAFVIVLIPLTAGMLPRQSKANGQASGRETYRSACAACHGADGRGAPDSTRGFEKPATFPDFTRCRATAREANLFWSSIVHNGGPGRGFSENMPSFREALGDDQIAKVLEYLRSFCREPAWPRGELNFPHQEWLHSEYREKRSCGCRGGRLGFGRWGFQRRRRPGAVFD